MIAMLDTSEDLKVCEAELGCKVEQLLTPLTRFNPQQPDAYFSIDNGFFAKCDPNGFRALLKREWERRDLCRFVTAPDIVANARRTLELFDHWYDELCHWNIALVAQDGLEDLPIDWKVIDAVFIGGSTDWKLSKHAADIIKTAKAMGKWVHAGRVNSPARFEYFEKLGADSIDGTGLSRYSWMRERIWKAHNEPHLFDGENHSSLSPVEGSSAAQNSSAA